MKKIVMIMLVSVLVISVPAFSQNEKGKSNAKSDKAQSEKTEKTEKAEKLEKPAKPNEGKVNDQAHGDAGKAKATEKSAEEHSKGHAYGKEKDSIRGKEFGQERAMEAKNKNAHGDKPETKVNQAAQTNSETKTKITQAREKLEAKKKAKQISEADYNKKKKEIDNLEKEVTDLDKKNEDIKGKLDKEKVVKPE